ncbi:ester cyclase [Acidaminobacter sp. JC074]|uniref:ester cyclase n=1 Tax=Acidaminobacter sp. JC074 TaxID=2530199 RepID=UPI001F112076|nr:ester cyclase [Acidaminobacter sp. JC074]MCH4888243.1 ester cyclase [Acidaminobacter sp. JC074]
MTEKKEIKKQVAKDVYGIHYGDSNEVNPVNNHDYNDFVKLSESKQNPKGFDKAYNDFVDYIMKITHEIWEEKGIGVIYDTYHNNVTMHFGAHNAVGIQSVIAGTLETLHAFPDRKLIGQNVVWSKFGENGYLSSHRIISTATNLNDSGFGPATGKKVNFRTTVDCAAENNRIFEEWLVRDNLWIVKQLGFDPVEVAKKMALNSKDTNGVNKTHFGKDENFKGQYFPEKYQAKDNSVGELVKEAYNNIYSCRLFNEVTKYYQENAVIHYICDKDLVGHHKIQGMLVSLFASFPNAKFTIDRITCNQRPEKDGHDVAVRWRISGLHEGLGMFGKPLGNAVEILGINHVKVIDGKIEEEWMTYDGLDVLRQIHIGHVDEEL